MDLSKMSYFELLMLYHKVGFESFKRISLIFFIAVVIFIICNTGSKK